MDSKHFINQTLSPLKSQKSFPPRWTSKSCDSACSHDSSPESSRGSTSLRMGMFVRRRVGLTLLLLHPHEMMRKIVIIFFFLVLSLTPLWLHSACRKKTPLRAATWPDVLMPSRHVTVKRDSQENSGHEAYFMKFSCDYRQQNAKKKKVCLCGCMWVWQKDDSFPSVWRL